MLIEKKKSHQENSVQMCARLTVRFVSYFEIIQLFKSPLTYSSPPANKKIYSKQLFYTIPRDCTSRSTHRYSLQCSARTVSLLIYRRSLIIDSTSSCEQCRCDLRLADAPIQLNLGHRHAFKCVFPYEDFR